MADIFALGDTALMVAENYPNGHPQVVQPSIQQASLLAKNLRHMIKGKPLRPFKIHEQGVHGPRSGGMMPWQRFPVFVSVDFCMVIVAVGSLDEYRGGEEPVVYNLSTGCGVT